MVLLFLRDWRSAIIVVLNIPFAILSSVVLLWAAGQTINIMTLGGLALAVGVLVDESTVEIENLHSHMASGVPRARAVVEATRLTVVPRLLSMLCILAVFLPSFFLAGVGRQLFVPLSLAVAFAMIASFLLSSSLVPVLSAWIMKEKRQDEEHTGVFGKLPQRLYAISQIHVCVFVGLWRSSTLVHLSYSSGYSFPAWGPRFSQTLPRRCFKFVCGLLQALA